MKLTTQQIDWLNIALLLGSAGAAYVLPFEVFLFSYAVLGPLHYLTEISWLHQRQYFATGKRDALWLLVLAAALFTVGFVVPKFTPRAESPATLELYQQRTLQAGAAITYLALMSAVAMAAFRQLSSKIIFVLIAVVFLLGLVKLQAWILLFAIFLPTLIHVYIFTAAFMLLGALRNRSWPGLLSFGLLLTIGTALLVYQPPVEGSVSKLVRDHYILFDELNKWFARLLGASPGDFDPYTSPFGQAIMRFIAFAYTYHYLNWFSKTSIIKWHQVNRWRLVSVFALWVLAVALYATNYKVGFIALYTLSFLHVFLEFPLNWRSFVDLGKECRGLVRHGWVKPATGGTALPGLAITPPRAGARQSSGTR